MSSNHLATSSPVSTKSRPLKVKWTRYHEAALLAYKILTSFEEFKFTVCAHLNGKFETNYTSPQSTRSCGSWAHIQGTPLSSKRFRVGCIRDNELRPMVAREIQLLKKAESTQQSSPSSTIGSLNDQVPCDSNSRRLGYAENCTKALEDANQSRQVQSIPNPRKKFNDVPEPTRTDAQRNTWKKTKGIS